MIRQVLIQKGLALFSRSPIIGIGASRFTKAFTVIELPELLKSRTEGYFNVLSIHNSYIVFLAESGLLGAIPYAILLLILRFSGLKNSLISIKENKFWNVAIYLSFLQMSIHMWSIASLTNSANWFVYGLVAALIMRGRKVTDVISSKA